MKRNRLNLGCGATLMDGWTNVDLREPCDFVCNANEYPWPWADESIDEILSVNMWEHLHDPLRALREAHRILKVGGSIMIGVPHIRSVYAVAPDHRHYFSRMWFLQMAEGTSLVSDPLLKDWDEVSYRVHLIGGLDVPVLDWAASRWPLKWEKWAPVQPDNIKWTARKIRRTA